MAAAGEGYKQTAIILSSLKNTVIVCYNGKKGKTTGHWQAENALTTACPDFIMQMTIMIAITRFLYLILRPLRQPRFVAEILAGILVGPSLLGRLGKDFHRVVPTRSLMTLETIGNLGLVYYMFLLGLEIDLGTVSRAGKRAIHIAISGTIIPLVMGAGFLYFLQYNDPLRSFNNTPTAWIIPCLFWGIILTMTGFSVLTQTLSELKLLHTEIGKIALSSALVCEMFTWILLVVIMGASNIEVKYYWVILSTVAFVLLYIFGVKLAVRWLISKIPEGESLNDYHICIVLVGVTLSSLLSDICGMHSITGAFLFGIIMPNGEIGAAISEKIEGFVTGLLLPLFFALIGFRANFNFLQDKSRWLVTGITVVGLCLAKILSTLLVTTFYNMRLREGLALGVLMNTKNLLALVILYMGRDRLVLDDIPVAVMILSVLVMSLLVMPITLGIYRPSRRFMQHKYKTILKAKPDAELRILACIYESPNVQGVINLLETANPTKQSPLSLIALHLVELTGRASAMLAVHTGRKSSTLNPTREEAESYKITTAFENYGEESTAVSVEMLTVVSPYTTMDEDICSLAVDKYVNFIILPFHKQRTSDGKMRETKPDVLGVNQNVLANAPCSAGIFIDRGLGAAELMGESGEFKCRIAVLFVVGRDDREALAFAWRMAGRPGVTLEVTRFIPGENVADVESMDLPDSTDGILSAMTNYEREKQVDDAFIKGFRVKTLSNDSMMYTEKVVNSGAETVAAMREMNHDYDLYVVGRGHGVVSPLTAGLSEWTDNPELGAVGDILVSSEFAASVSVLVMQQFAGAEYDKENMSGMINGLPGHKEQYNTSLEDDNGGRKPFVHHSGY